MAAPTFVSASAGTTDATGPWTHTGPAPGATGRIVIVHLLQDGTNAGVPAITSVTNAANIGGVANVLTKIGQFDVGSPTPTARHHVWIGRTTSASGAMVITGTNTGGDDVYVRVYLFSGVSAATSLARVIENVTRGSTGVSAGTSATASDAAVTTLGPDRLVLNLLAIDDDNPVGPFSGQTGGTWAEATAEYATQSGTDGCIQIQTATLATAGTIDGGTASITDVDNWGVVGFALLPTGPAVYSGSVVNPVTSNRVTNGVRRTASQIAAPFTVSAVTAGRVQVWGVVSWANFTNPLPVSVKGIAAIDASWTAVSSGRQTKSRGVVSLPVGFNVTVTLQHDLATYGGGTYGSGTYGDEIKTAAASFDLAGEIVTSGAPLNPQTVSGASSFEIAADATVNGVRVTFGAVVAPETVDRVTSGRLGISDQITLVMSHTVGSSAFLAAVGAASLPVAFDSVTRSIVGGTIAGNTALDASFSGSTSGTVIARSSVHVNEGAFFAVSSIQRRRGITSSTFSTVVQSAGRLTARSAVSLPLTFGITTGRITQFGAVDLNLLFNARTMRATYNPPRNGYIAFPRRGRLRKGSQVTV